ncbi:MAG TPA: RimK/LysX family protein [Candidatus Woesearchaeota archaeon]|nr:RimK/LysX family protein [Candidatus Woesearchaeota archaeon]
MEDKETKRKTIGLTCKAKLFGKKTGHRELLARVDTGAALCSVDLDIAAELRLGPIVKAKKVRSSNASMKRPIVKAQLEVEGKKIVVSFSISDRSHMSYPVLIGRNALKKFGFLIDPVE